MRLFIAIETPPEIRELIGRLVAPLRALNAPVKWEQNDKLHVTLKFLGDTPEEKVPAIIAALKSAAMKAPGPFLIRYTAPGMFPNRHRPRIIWIGVDDPRGVMTQVQSAVEQSLEQLGIQREQRPFHPHVTIGRVKGERIPDRLLEEVENLTLHTDEVPVSEFTLVKSETKSDGSVYTVLERFPIDRGKT